MESYKIGELVEVRINLYFQAVFYIISAFFLSIICMYFRKKEQKMLKRRLKTGLMEMKTVLGINSNILTILTFKCFGITIFVIVPEIYFLDTIGLTNIF